MAQESPDRYMAMADNLKRSGYKLTPQRLAIIKLLSENKSHPSVEDIYTKLRRRFPGISQATVYRNILLMKSLGEVIEIGFASGSSRYDGRKPFPHPHIVCLRCNKIIDPELDTLHEMTKEITEESGFEIVTYRLDFFGICSECRNKK
jgi:Fur family transcriptional regulator, peroxide stress response regulator